MRLSLCPNSGPQLPGAWASARRQCLCLLPHAQPTFRGGFRKVLLNLIGSRPSSSESVVIFHIETLSEDSAPGRGEALIEGYIKP